MKKRTVRQIGGQGGLTMMEIIAVLIIIGILAAIAINKMSSSSDTGALSSQMEIFEGHLRYAQSRAMNTGNVWGINSSSASYFLFYNGSTANTTKLPGQSSATYTIPNGVSITAGAGNVAFDGWGKPYSDAAGTTALASDLTITLSKGSQSMSTKVTKNTGFIP